MRIKTKIALLMANDASAYHITKFLSERIYSNIDIIHYQPHTISNSKYINRFIIVYSPFENIKRTVADIIEVNKQYSYDLIIPVNDVALEIGLLIKDQTKNLLMHNDAISDSFRSKISIWELVAKLHLPHLSSQIITSKSEFESIRDELALPLVAKPNKSAEIFNDRVHKFGVRVTSTSQEIDNFIYDHTNIMSILIQDMISGFGVGFNFFSINGQIKSYYAHERLTEHNGGGASSLRKTISADKYDLLNISEQIIKEMNWTGIGMLEFRVKDGVAYIMELNGRAWGSLMLGEKSGSNPVYDYIDWALNNRIPIYNGYRKNVVGRKLKEDIKNQGRLLKRGKVFKLIPWILSFRYELFGKGFIEDLFLYDLRFAKSYWFPFFKPKKQMNEMKELKLIHKSMKICFICYGNINRSPFAEHLLKQLVPGINCISTGINNFSSRKASRQAIQCATKYNCNLEYHKSSYIKEKDLDSYIIVVMDTSNIIELNKLGYHNNIYRLSLYDIQDPHGKEDKVYEKSYNDIYNCLKYLTEEVNSNKTI